MQGSVTEWLGLLTLAGGMGVLGQTVRIAIGLKKQYDEATAIEASPTDLVSGKRIGVSLLLGFAAGAASVLATDSLQFGTPISHTILLGFMAAGYAGADALEGLASRFMPRTEESKKIDDAARVGAKQEAVSLKERSAADASADDILKAAKDAAARAEAAAQKAEASQAGQAPARATDGGE